jgi:hypothetical protein
MDIQKLMDTMNQAAQLDRANTQLTLGELLATLRAMPLEKEIPIFYSAHSYRGYYCDLAFGKQRQGTVKEALEYYSTIIGETFQGYKGGDFTMGKSTPLWLAKWGYCGERIVAFTSEGNYITAEDDG